MLAKYYITTLFDLYAFWIIFGLHSLLKRLKCLQLMSISRITEKYLAEQSIPILGDLSYSS